MSFSVFAQLGIVLDTHFALYTIHYNIKSILFKCYSHFINIWIGILGHVLKIGVGVACACVNSCYYTLVDILWTQWNASRGWKTTSRSNDCVCVCVCNFEEREREKEITKHPSFFTLESWQTTKRIRKCAFKYASHIKYGYMFEQTCAHASHRKCRPWPPKNFDLW